MKAAVLRGVKKPLSIEDVEIDKPGPHEVLIRTAAAGVCHSDLHFLNGLVPLPDARCARARIGRRRRDRSAPRCATSSRATTSSPASRSSAATASTA